MKRDVVRKTKIGTLLGCVLLATACATVEEPNTPEALVRRLATERLNALRAGDYAKALSYANPSYRLLNGVDQYRSRYGGAENWKGAEVDNVSCDPERCRVRLLITYRMAQLEVENTRPLDELWIAIDGQWYIFEG